MKFGDANEMFRKKREGKNHKTDSFIIGREVGKRAARFTRCRLEKLIEENLTDNKSIECRRTCKSIPNAVLQSVITQAFAC